MGWDALSSPVRWSIAGIFGLLVLATLATQVLARLRPEADVAELRQRVKTWWIMAAVFVLAMLMSRTVSLVFLGFISFLALKEYLSLIPTRRADRRVMFWAYLAVAAQYVWVALAWYGMFRKMIIKIVDLLGMITSLKLPILFQNVRAAGTLHWGLMTMVYSLSHAAFLLVLEQPGAAGPSPGPGLMLYLVFLTQLNDVAQYVWGRSLGKRKIVPAVSPGKTWGGFLGGVATTIGLATLLGPWLTPMDWRQSLGAGVIIGLGGFIGDVTISAIKRDLGVKDSGALLPGHGGVLDRVDSLTYTAPLFFHYVYWLFLWQTHGA